MNSSINIPYGRGVEQRGIKTGDGRSNQDEGSPIMISESYVYKKRVDWSILTEGLTLPIDNQIVFGQIMGRFLQRGEAKDITLYLGGKAYKAKITFFCCRTCRMM
ncbi:MAG TPA: hypothetical protein PLZ84_01680 [Clostridia bacterium]|nr:hypothetical protein [Clostridia bacterium]